MPAAPHSFDVGELRIDLNQQDVTRAGEPIRLTPTEFKLLVLLAQHAGKVLTHWRIFEAVWGPAHVTQGHCMRVHRSGLRQKIKQPGVRGNEHA